MKKIFKNQKIKYLLFTILGVIIGGSIGITATTYVLQSSEIQYKDNKSVQEVIEELYVLAQNSGNTQTLPIGNVVNEGYTITVPYTGSYLTIGCVYGVTENYGSTGTISNNTCIFNGTSANQQLYYRISAIDINGKIYEYSGNTKTSVSGVTIVKDSLPIGVKAIVYLDPTNLGTACNESNSTSTTGTKSGCMKWYAFREDSTSYTMILDHNTTATVAWNSSGSNISMNEVQKTLTSDTAGWSGSPRLITGKEIADITGNTSWTTSTTSSGWFYFDSNNQTQTATSTGASKYYWLYDYTNGCTSYGCKLVNSSTAGYWTSTSISGSTDSAWVVNRCGFLSSGSVYSPNFCGVRPVITISKSNL